MIVKDPNSIIRSWKFKKKKKKERNIQLNNKETKNKSTQDKEKYERYYNFYSTDIWQNRI